MTPKEKALDLMRYYDCLNSEKSKNVNFIYSQQRAINDVNKKIEIYFILVQEYKYWEQVKKEIENL